MVEAEGWKWLLNGPSKDHYYRAGLALCGRYSLMYIPVPGALASFDVQAPGPGPRDCVVCWRERAKEVQAKS